MGTLTITERLSHESVRTTVDAAESFEDATDKLIAWMWRDHTLAMAQHVVKVWMRGERYADHSVNMRYYVPGTVGHWFDILYRA